MKRILIWSAVLAGGLLLLPAVLPVVLGVLLALGLEPGVLALRRRTGLGRGLCGALLLSALLGLLAAGGWVLGRQLLGALGRLSGEVPAMAATLGRWETLLGARILRFSRTLPDGAGQALRDWWTETARGGGAWAARLPDRALELAAGLLSRLPGLLMGAVTLLLSALLALAELPSLREQLRAAVPEGVWVHLSHLGRWLRGTLGRWLRAQVRLMGCTWLVLSGGLFLLGVEKPGLLGLEIALLDALPVLGTGTVLLPWALCAILTGRGWLGLGLGGLYLLAALVRRMLEPRLLGSCLGLGPLLTLGALYGGWRLGGLRGMLLLPLAAALGAALLRQRASAGNPV